jgi:hypothetical protein
MESTSSLKDEHGFNCEMRRLDQRRAAQFDPYNLHHESARRDFLIVLGHDYFDPAIQLPAGGGLVAGDGKRLAIAAGDDAVGLDSLCDQ